LKIQKKNYKKLKKEEEDSIKEYQNESSIMIITMKKLILSTKIYKNVNLIFFD